MNPTLPNVDPKGKYNVTQTAKALGCSRSALYNYINQGKIAFDLTKDQRKIFIGKDIIKFRNNY